MKYWIVLFVMLIGWGCDSSTASNNSDARVYESVDMLGQVLDSTFSNVPDAMATRDGAIQIDVGDMDAGEIDVGEIDASGLADAQAVFDALPPSDAQTNVDALPDVQPTLDASVDVGSDSMLTDAPDAMVGTDCGNGSYLEVADDGFRCVPCRLPCDIGETETTPCSENTNRVCESCGFETYDHDQNRLTECVECTQRCSAGTEETQTCTPTTNRVCLSCVDGQFDHDRSPSTACIACSAECLIGFTEVRACTAMLDRVCAQCDVGQFDHDNDADTQCIECRGDCVPGETETRRCSAQTDRVCESCAAGFFDDDNDPTTPCQSCRRPCGPGEDESQACTATTNRRCDGCEDGEYLNDGLCEVCSECGVGTTLTSACTTSNDSVCTPCADGFFDADASALTPCIACSQACDSEQTEVVGCTAATDRVCSGCRAGEMYDESEVCVACPLGTFDHDSDANTPCVTCTQCDRSQVRWGQCGVTEDVSCVECGSNPSNVSYAPLLPGSSMGEPCGPTDPDCTQVIDVVIFYTPAFFALIDEDLDKLEDLMHHTIYMANQSLEQSMLAPTMRYRLLGAQRFEYEERDQLKSDLMWLRNNPHYQAVRRSWGADLGLFLLGTQGYGGYAYSNSSNATADRERGIAVIDGYYLLGDFNRCGTTYETPAHELGHILGAAHRASMFQNPTGTNYGYHNQEPLYRRNHAFGLPVSQHDLKLFTLMSYSSYKNEQDRTTGCLDCEQLSVFASPDLWWFFHPLDPLHGFCLEIHVTDDGQVDLVCNGPDAWVVEDGEYVLNETAAQRLTTQAVIDRAVPMGVDQPTYLDPQDGVTPISEVFSTRNRDRVENRWSMKATNARPLAPMADCPSDCEGVNRVICSVGRTTCGVCLPGYFEVGGICLGRVEADPEHELHDEKYLTTAVTLDHSEELLELNVDLNPGSTVHRVELYLMTVDELGDPDYSWVSIGSTIWVANEAPAHQFTVYAVLSNGQEVELGSDSTVDAAVNDSNAQKNHVLTYVLDSTPALENVDGLRVVMTSDSAFGFSISELRVFGD